MPANSVQSLNSTSKSALNERSSSVCPTGSSEVSAGSTPLHPSATSERAARDESAATNRPIDVPPNRFGEMAWRDMLPEPISSGTTAPDRTRNVLETHRWTIFTLPDQVRIWEGRSSARAPFWRGFPHAFPRCSSSTDIEPRGGFRSRRAESRTASRSDASQGIGCASKKSAMAIVATKPGGGVSSTQAEPPPGQSCPPPETVQSSTADPARHAS